jgi:hypothetical protein
MATVKKGTLASAKEWWKHLRKYNKRVFWSAERRAARADIRRRINEQAG